MGKTAPTPRKQMEKIFEEWKPYREALRKRERRAYDELLEMAKSKGHAIHHQGFIDPVQGVLLSILLEQQLKIKRQDQKIKDLKEKTMGLD